MDIKHDLYKLVVARQIAAAGLLVSAVIHFVLTPEHLRESLLLGLGFVGVAVLQLLLGSIFLLRPAPLLWPGAVILTVFSLTVYVISRSVGLPFGHEHGPEAIELIDMIAKGAELTALGGLAMSIIVGRTTGLLHQPAHGYRFLFELIGLGILAALLAIRLGSYLSPLEDHHDHGGGAPPMLIADQKSGKELVHGYPN